METAAVPRVGSVGVDAQEAVFAQLVAEQNAESGVVFADGDSVLLVAGSLLKTLPHLFRRAAFVEQANRISAVAQPRAEQKPSAVRPQRVSAPRVAEAHRVRSRSPFFVERGDQSCA